MKHHFSIVIPTYNEEARIHRCFSALNRFKAPKSLVLDKIIFVNDGSTDKTLKLLKSFKSKHQTKIITYVKNRGKGYAVRKGMLSSGSSYTLLIDADISTPLSEIGKFIPFVKSGIDVIIGTRKNGHSTVTIHQPWIRENMGKVFTFVSRQLLNVNVTDFTCGFKMFHKKVKNEIFTRSKINRWGYDSEILFLSHKLGYNIVEKAVMWANQKETKVNLFIDTFDSLKELVQIRLNYFLNKYNIKYNTN